MNQKIIPIYSQSDISTALVPSPMDVTGEYVGAQKTGPVNDHFGRPLRDLRISVTDRCNFRCVYCMPKQVFGKDFVFIPHDNMLSFEEITRVAEIFVSLGVEKIRLTGGEPLLRRNIERLIEQLRQLKTPDGKEIDLTLTTNGSILAAKAQSLYDAGLKRITVSLDALDDSIFRRMNDVDFSVNDVLKGIEVAHQVGFSPIKLNVVVKKGVNDQQILPIARYFKNTPFIPRFIEYMDVGSSNNWQAGEIIPSSQVIQMIHEEMPLESVEPNYTGETAERWRYLDGSGEIGVIASVTQAFCSDCTRVRLSTEGKLYTCLFATAGYDIRAWVRSGKTNEDITQTIAHHWKQRNDRYSELRSAKSAQSAQLAQGEITERKIEMSYIGG